MRPVEGTEVPEVSERRKNLGRDVGARGYALILVLVWTLLTGLSLTWNYYDEQDDVRNAASVAARAQFDKDVLYRRWNARHGGVYVPITKSTQPNPYLTRVRERDIETLSGRKLTLINPAYMTRQVHELGLESEGVRGHITSLNLIRPANAPDAWEKRALESFEHGKPEYASIETIEGKSYLRLMRPLITEKQCLKCHAEQGYRKGDVRGGISVSVPMAPYTALAHQRMITMAVGHGALWLLGVMGFALGAQRIGRHDAERDRAEEALREGEERTRALFDAVTDAVFLHPLLEEGFALFTDVNNTACTRYGYTREEFLRMRAPDITKKADADAHSAPENRRELREAGRLIFETTHIAKSGEEFPVEINSAVIELGGRRMILAVVRDITERKRAEQGRQLTEKRYRSLYEESRRREQLYESLLNSTPDAVIIYNLTGEAEYVNPAFSRIYGFSKEEVLGRRIPFVPESERSKTKENIEKVLKGLPVAGFETRRIAKDGRVLDITLSSSSYYDHEGKLAGAVAIHRDVSSAKKIEQQLIHAQKMEAVGTIAGGVAHDFNNLLQAVQGYAEILLLGKQEGDPGYRELSRISHAARRGGELTRQLLTFSRKVESNPRPIDINQQVLKVEELLERTIPKMIKIEASLDAGFAVVNADPTQIEQVLMNLAVNAKDAMPEGGRFSIATKNVTLDGEFCKAHMGARPGEYVEIRVSDTGHGISKESLARIFEPFFTTKRIGEGTGLGLAMVYGIVKNHNGYITCDSSLGGGGTTFTIYLPVIEQRDRPEKMERAKVALKGGKEAILLVDDEDFVRESCEQMLTTFGYTVLAAEDGESALEIYGSERDRIDLVILDLIMPGMGGERCFEELIKLNPRVKIIISSGFSLMARAEEVVARGAKAFVSKPYKLEQILQAVRSVLSEG